MMGPRRLFSHIIALATATLVALLVSQGVGTIWPTSKVALFLFSFFAVAVWIYRGEKRGRETLLRGLAILPEPQREALLKGKFKPIEAELRRQLRERHQII
jgi:hypothetical protein